MEKIMKFNKDVGPGKKSKLINVRPTFIPELRVHTYFAFKFW